MYVRVARMLTSNQRNGRPYLLVEIGSRLFAGLAERDITTRLKAERRAAAIESAVKKAMPSYRHWPIVFATLGPNMGPFFQGDQALSQAAVRADPGKIVWESMNIASC